MASHHLGALEVLWVCQIKPFTVLPVLPSRHDCLKQSLGEPPACDLCVLVLASAPVPLGGYWRRGCVIRSIVAPVDEQCPDGACVLVGQRHRRDILVAAVEQPPKPGVRWGLACGDPSHRAGTVNEQGTQIGVTPLSLAKQRGLAATGVLPGHEPEPGGEPAAIGEGLRVTDRGHERTGRDRADAGDFLEPAAGFVLPVPDLDLGFELIYLAVQLA